MENKGSKLQIQLLATRYPLLFEVKIGELVRWICPKDRKEFQLNSHEMINELGLAKDSFDHFWPSRQPQWDGLAIGLKTGILYLIETKSHLSEICPGNFPPKTTNDKKSLNYNMKCNAITYTMNLLKVKVDDKIWLHKYYQISNRIVFLRKMKELCPSSNYSDENLVFINFINDPYWIQKKMNPTENKWQRKYDKIFAQMGVTNEMLLNQNIQVICIDSANMEP